MSALRYLGRAHLADDARRTFCGQQVPLGIGGPTTDPVDCALCVKVRDGFAARLREQVEHDSWTRGDLRFILDETQQRIYDAAHAAWGKNKNAPLPTELTIEALSALPEVVAGALCSRRLGKSAVACVISTEACLRKPGTVIKYIAKDAVDVGIIVEKIMEDVVLKTCPAELRPAYKKHEGVYVFANGSRIEFYGANDGKIEDLRGHAADGVVPDEIGSWQHPEYALNSVIKPMVLTTRGWIFIVTTPAKTAGHESKAIVDDLAKRGLLSRFTLCDSRRIPPILKAKFLVEAGETPEHALEVIRSNGRVLPKSTTARREYFVLWVTDAGSAILPEFQDMEEKIVVRVVDALPEHPTEGYRYVVRPRFFFGRTTIDPAPVNIMAILHGYHDFERDVIVIQREKFARGAETTTQGVADAIHGGERIVWGDTRFAGGRKQPSKRVIDPDSRLEADLRREHDLSFTHAEKKDWDAGIRALRMMIQGVRIEIDESCVELRRQMRENVFNNKATGFAMEADGSHGDGISCALYLVRSVRRSENPFPQGYLMPNRSQDVQYPTPRKEPSIMPATPIGERMEKFATRVHSRLFGRR